MPRLIHLAGYVPPQRGSFIPFLAAVLGAAAERGWSTEAVFPEQAAEREWVEELRAAGAAVHFASGSRRRLTDWLGEHLDADREPTVLHTHFTVYDVPAALAARRRPDVHAFWHIHTVLSEGPRAVLANSLKFALFGRYVERIIAPSAGVAGAVKRRLGSAAKISLLPSPIDPRAFPLLTAADRAGSRDQLGVPEGTRALLHFGRDWEIKDGEIFLDALALLVGEGREAIGLINQGGEEARLGADRRGLAEQVRMPGMLPDANVFYGAADVLVACSRGEGMPFTVVEALCSGTPVVASDIPGHRYFGDRFEACTIVARDANQYADAIEGFLDMDPGERSRRCEVAREWIVQHLDLEATARRLVDDYEQAVYPAGVTAAKR